MTSSGLMPLRKAVTQVGLSIMPQNMRTCTHLLQKLMANQDCSSKQLVTFRLASSFSTSIQMVEKQSNIHVLGCFLMTP